MSKTDVQAIIEQLTPKQREQLEREVLFSLAKHDTPAGFAAFFEILHGTPLHAEGERWIENAYQAHERGLGLAQECHREAGKTTVFSKFFFAFRIGHNPASTSAIVRINDQKANQTTAGVARIIESDPAWRLIFPHVVPDKDRGWGANGYFVRRTDLAEAEWARVVSGIPDDPTFVGYGVGSGSIIGSRFSGCLVVDDIHNEDNTTSVRELARIKKFITDTLTLCVMDGCWELWNFTPWTENDAYQMILATGEYLHNKSPVMVAAEEGEEGAEEWPKAIDVPLSGKWWKRYDPERWPWERLTSLYRKTMAIGFARMMLLDLEATKGLNLKAEWLHYYPSEDIDPSWPVFMGIDYASTADKLKARQRDSDYFALAVLRAIPGGGLVLVDGVRKRLSKGEALSVVSGWAGKYDTLQLIGVETVGVGKEFYNDLVLVDDAFGRVLPLLSITHGRKSKGQRIQQSLAPRFQFSRIWISTAETQFLRVFRDEWLSFPLGTHDDTLDAVYMAAEAGAGHTPAYARFKTGRKPKANPYKVFGDMTR